MNPRSWAVAADIPMTMVKLPAAGVPTSAAGLAGGAAAGLAGGVITGRMLETSTGLRSEVLTLGAGMDASVGVAASAGRVAWEACAGDVLAAGVLDGDLLGDAAGALTDTVPAAAGIVVMAGLVAASAVAVRVTEVTEVTEVALEATGIWACTWYADGDTVVPIDPIVQVAVPFPPGQRLVNSGTSPCGAAVSVTDTPEAGPFWAETCTVKDAAWPGLMPDSDAWTLTHSSAADEDEAAGDADAAAGSGSHWELRKVSAAVAADAAGLPSAPLTKPRAREPTDIRQAASTRTFASRIRAGLSRCHSRKSQASGADGNVFGAAWLFFPASFQDTSRAPARYAYSGILTWSCRVHSACVFSWHAKYNHHAERNIPRALLLMKRRNSSRVRPLLYKWRDLT